MPNSKANGILKLILTFGYLICFHTVLLAQIDCSQILQHGIYNYTSTDFNNERLQSFINWFKSENIQTYQQAKSSTFNVTVPIDDIIVGLGYSQDENGFQQVKNYLETYNSQTLAEKTKLSQTIQKIEPEIIKSWNNCIQTMNQGVVILWIEHTSNPNTFNLCAQYDDVVGSIITVGKLEFDIDTSRIKVSNNGAFLKKNLLLNTSKIITNSTLRQAITVKGDDNFVINISGIGRGLKYSFKPLIEPPKEYLDNTLAIKGTLIKSEARISGSPLLNTKGKTVYLHLTGIIKIIPTTSSNRTAFRVTAKDNHSPDPKNPIVKSFTPRWVIYDNLREETTYPIDQVLLFPKDKEYYFEVYGDQADGVLLKSELNYCY